MKKSIIGEKSFAFAIRIVNLYKYLTNEQKEYVLSKQLLRSGTSIGANYREATCAQTPKDFLYKLTLCHKEAAETDYWLDLLIQTGYIEEDLAAPLKAECLELNKMLTSAVIKLKSRV
ncbi:four helix bundle protein [Tindallia californiensis]|uniref:Four helix bundle protein n=1 Tax=Tindallia californiensis TaxID=159292 RepID=A0A1H3PEZ7_9FIRM|nr:four helix bundle protein [Tindallia californiensis]SDY99523.1 four helix bundle protein [Tindallia californiensis]